MTYKNAKTILFASLIAAMILPFSGMNYATAEESEYEYPPEIVTKASIQEELKQVADVKEKLNSKLETDLTEKERQRTNYMLRSAILQEKVLTDPKNSERYSELANSIMDRLLASFDESQITQGVSVEISEQELTAESTQSYKTTTTERGRYGGGSYVGYSDGTINAHTPFTSTWSNIWHYPSYVTSYDDGSKMYHEESKIYIVDDNSVCWSFVDDFREDIWCGTIGYGDSVVIYSNAIYELPPDDTQTFNPFWGWAVVNIK